MEAVYRLERNCPGILRPRWLVQDPTDKARAVYRMEWQEHLRRIHGHAKEAGTALRPINTDLEPATTPDSSLCSSNSPPSTPSFDDVPALDYTATSPTATRNLESPMTPSRPGGGEPSVRVYNFAGRIEPINEEEEEAGWSAKKAAVVPVTVPVLRQPPRGGRYARSVKMRGIAQMSRDDLELQVMAQE